MESSKIVEVQNEFSSVTESQKDSNTIRNFSASFLPVDVQEEIQMQWREGIELSTRNQSMFVQNSNND